MVEMWGTKDLKDAGVVEQYNLRRMVLLGGGPEVTGKKGRGVVFDRASLETWYYKPYTYHNHELHHLRSQFNISALKHAISVEGAHTELPATDYYIDGLVKSGDTMRHAYKCCRPLNPSSVCYHDKMFKLGEVLEFVLNGAPLDPKWHDAFTKKIDEYVNRHALKEMLGLSDEPAVDEEPTQQWWQVLLMEVDDIKGRMDWVINSVQKELNERA